MSLASLSAVLPSFADLISSTGWKMLFQSVHFLLFLPVAAGAYFLLPRKCKKVWLLFVSYYFYLFAAPRYLPVLVAGTLLTYLFGRLIGAASTPGRKRLFSTIGVVLVVLNLLFFKYNGIFAHFLSPLLQPLGISYAAGDYFIAAKALGLSFYSFAAIGYLVDTARGDVPAEKNLISYALFLGFFPAVQSGPISRAGSFLPQLEALPEKHNPQNTADALRLMAVGFFKKMAVSDTLAVFSNHVFSDELGRYSGPTMILAAFVFALQLYFDFSGYSDIAFGTAKLFGIKIPENFNTPYFATNFSGFWSRWHISLSTWLQDYIFTPLVWSRWPEKLPLIGKKISKPPMLSSIAIVFLISGIWHGDTFSFVIWGALQAVFRIGEELLHRLCGKPKKKPPLASRIGKTAVVVILWTQSLLFFRVGLMPNMTAGDAFAAFLRQFSGFSGGFASLGNTFYQALYLGVYPSSLIIAAFSAFMLACLGFALYADWVQFARLKGKHYAYGIAALPKAQRWAVYYLLLLACFAGFLLINGGVGGSFIYGGF